jgi:phospholipase C
MRATVCTVIAAATLALPAGASAAVAPRTPIKHVISLMQENHSFDNYFGTYPGADGTPAGTCQPYSVTKPKAGCVKPYRIGNRAIEDLNHGPKIFRAQYRRGRMDGFMAAFVRASGGLKNPQTMGYYDDGDIPYYWNVADNYTLFDRFFTSAKTGSLTNHMYWATGTSGHLKTDGVIPEKGFGDLTTIFDRLEEKGISWKFYVQNYDPRITFRARILGDRGSQIVWVPLLNYGRYIDDPRLFSHIVPLEQYYEDLRRGTLPAVSYVAPSGSSEHPPGSIKAGETFVRTMINALMRSSAWPSSAFTWTYDDWGGWYDHVKPPQVDASGYGFRAPALLVSPFAKRGYVSHETLDFTSILKFIEENWGLRPMASRDRRARSIADGFDFAAGPRNAVFLSRAREVPRRKEPKRAAVYVSYSIALLLVLFVIGLAMLHDRRRGRGASRPEPEAVTS